MDTSPNHLQKGIWIASYPKSGNTWVRIFIHNLLREIRGQAAGPQDINRLNQHTVWEIDTAPYQTLLGRHPMECTPEEIARTRPEVQRLLSEARSKPFFLKTHSCFAKVEGYSTINLDMTLAAIYVVRNPLDVAISYAHHSSLDIDHIIAQMANPSMRSHVSVQHVPEFMGSWSFHVASWLSISTRPVHVMRYEDMVASPLRAFGALAAFLRLTPTAVQLARALEHSSFSQLRTQESQSGFREKPEAAKEFFRAGRVDQWQEVLTKKQVAQIVKDHAPIMQRGGYLLPNCGADIAPPAKPSRNGNAPLAEERNSFGSSKESTNTAIQPGAS